jgi:hypothetical protein
MSWNVDIIGKPQAVRTALDNLNAIPQELKALVDAVIEAAKHTPGEPRLLRVETSGHLDPNFGGDIYRFTTSQPTLAPDNPEDVAARLYTAYRAAVGGKAFNGDPLPDWATFRSDPTKKLQSDAWIAAARAV